MTGARQSGNAGHVGPRGSTGTREQRIRALAAGRVGPLSIAVRTGVDYRFVLAVLRLRVEEVGGELVDAGMGES